MIHPLTEKKEELKELAIEIRKIKHCLKKKSREEFPELKKYFKSKSLWMHAVDLLERRISYRHQHIAYCEVRGRNREEIEKPREGNEPSESQISKYIEDLTNKIKKYDEERKGETLRRCA